MIFLFLRDGAECQEADRKEIGATKQTKTSKHAVASALQTTSTRKKKRERKSEFLHPPSAAANVVFSYHLHCNHPPPKTKPNTPNNHLSYHRIQLLQPTTTTQTKSIKEKAIRTNPSPSSSSATTSQSNDMDKHINEKAIKRPQSNQRKKSISAQGQKKQKTTRNRSSSSLPHHIVSSHTKTLSQSQYKNNQSSSHPDPQKAPLIPHQASSASRTKHPPLKCAFGSHLRG